MKLQFLEAGQIVSTHGVRGEMKVLPWSDGPDFLPEFQRVCICGTVYTVESCRIQKTCNLLKVKGIDTIEQAQLMRGKTVEVFREDAPDGMIFVAELIGMDVIAEGESIGKIADVLDYPGNKVYVVKGEYEYMIPAVSQFIENIDMDAGVMRVRLIEGMRTDEN
ncbi:MAG: 16S rRNA processing protein RimM [Oscillospiraceae bacterium]|nr:16S rRNA processing protein RimM [Oscillospiraceae bacterium]